MDLDLINIIRLDITPAARQYAKNYGAKFDKEIGWYFIGDIPIELEEFVIRLPRTQNSNVTVGCPICGSQMKLVESKIGNVFWGCMLFPKCRGSRDIAKTEGMYDAKRFADFARSKDDSKKNSASFSVQLSELAIKNLGNPSKVEKWFATPKLTLGGKKPIEVMRDSAGQELLLEMLREINN